MSKRHVLVRAEAGIFVGALEKYGAKEATLKDARRLWYWTGAASLSQLATEGTKDPKNCKFPCAVVRVVLPEVKEMIDMTAKAKKSIDAVPVWEIT